MAQGDETELSGHLYATEAESREQVTDFYRRAWAQSDAITRESIDGAAGVREGSGDLPAEAGAAGWKRHHDKLESIARSNLRQ